MYREPGACIMPSELSRARLSRYRLENMLTSVKCTDAGDYRAGKKGW